jgi:hypothetical protein
VHLKCSLTWDLLLEINILVVKIQTDFISWIHSLVRFTRQHVTLQGTATVLMCLRASKIN